MSNGAETTDGFLGLPTELRLQIYGYIADTVPIPTSSTMEPYQGLILSCRQVYHEFESEAVKSVNQFLKASKAKMDDHPLRRSATLIHNDKRECTLRFREELER
ncbi:hypothetical protein HBI46_038320 [Parastagonospora nodorum]|nr:hypothetical protein HBI71_071030 [Parastagonospora nodorum]KAH5425756.1 hypothetical protein HBI46_038320 [Parastagonospora nodorum]KAH5492271.1 hypothetical protein HBI31_121030 [Parastagonospora nodorum]KAH5550467.1 hypothetical protein HBI27_019050 [Parastagonospora nodorum]